MTNQRTRPSATAPSKQYLLIVLIAVSKLSVHGFQQPVFATKNRAATALSAPSKTNGVSVEMPNFDELFSRIKQVSPLAKIALEGRDGGFFVMDDKVVPGMKWKTIEKKKNGAIHQIEKIDNFQDLGCPILRFRSSLQGPCMGEAFSDILMELEEREKWDAQIDALKERYPVSDLNEANKIMGDGKYGECTKLGVGYCRTKSNIVVSAREQLMLCGLQEIPENGAFVIWGVEMEAQHDNMFPQEIPRCTRAKSHLFSTTLVPTGPDSFDVEYVLQMDVGGKIPTWMTSPVISETVKSLFKYAKKYFGEGEGGELDRYIKERQPALDLFGKNDDEQREL